MRTRRHLRLVTASTPRTDEHGVDWHHGAHLAELMNDQPVHHAIAAMRRNGLSDSAIAGYYEVLAPDQLTLAKAVLARPRVTIGPIP